MREEKKKPNGEVNETALENVSGGSETEFTHLKDRTLQNYCGLCDRAGKRPGKCGHGSIDLTNYIIEHGDIGHWRFCPFYRQ